MQIQRVIHWGQPMAFTVLTKSDDFHNGLPMDPHDALAAEGQCHSKPVRVPPGVLLGHLKDLSVLIHSDKFHHRLPMGQYQAFTVQK